MSFLQVLHIRNLPYETTEEELRELCSAFGPIVQTKLNVGANKNQAFVEFPELNMAINMVSYYANSADPAKVSPGFSQLPIPICSCTLFCIRWISEDTTCCRRRMHGIAQLLTGA